MDEAFAGTGHEIAVLSMDLEKAYEHVSLPLLWLITRIWGFPSLLLALTLEAYSFPRVVTLGEAFAAPVRPQWGLPAGSRFAP
eukprot:5950642-Prorocentrum_lima.AAC.1